ncbi:MAG TPA: hypothetical protein VK539_03120 [Myxococcaceae bacterium]|nr:hypothetical protein [Myxococcaceae bacterium]
MAENSNQGAVVGWTIAGLAAAALAGLGFKSLADSARRREDALQQQLAELRDAQLRPSAPTQLPTAGSTGNKVAGAVKGALDAVGGLDGLFSLFRKK